MSVYFIGCLHLGHESIAEMRGFPSSGAHDKVLLDGINSVITKRDKLFILGDITMETAKHYHKLDSIRGYKHVIMGNHDRHTDLPELLKHVNGACGCMKYKKRTMLSHIPIHPIEFDYRVSLNIHAHLHSKSTNDLRYYNVDAARIGYVPISWEKIVVDVAMGMAEAKAKLAYNLTMEKDNDALRAELDALKASIGHAEKKEYAAILLDPKYYKSKAQSSREEKS